MCMHLENATHIARKQHQCSWCGQMIEAGSKYVRQRIIGDDAEPCTNKLHPECDDALSEAARAEGGCVYFDFGGQERPERQPLNGSEKP